MSSFVVDVKNRQVLQALNQLTDAMTTDVDHAVRGAALEVGNLMRKNAPKTTSQLAVSIKEDQIALMQWRVGPHVNYAQYVEEGTRRGGNVPFQAMLDWVKDKHIQPHNPKWDLNDLAWVIKRKIQLKGSPKQPFVQPIIDSGWAQQRLDQLVAKAVERSISEAGL